MLSGLTNNRDTGLDLGIRASHKGIDGGHCGVSCNSNIPLLKTSSNFDGHFTETISPRVKIIFNTKPESRQHRLAVSLCMLSKLTWTFSFYKKKKSVNWHNRAVEKPRGCWAYLPVSDHNRWPLCSALAPIFPKNDESVANWPCHRLWHRHVCGVLMNEVVFLTVNHRGPLPLRELHSTDETIVWRDPGGSWAPFTTRFWLRVNSPFQRL